MISDSKGCFSHTPCTIAAAFAISLGAILLVIIIIPEILTCRKGKKQDDSKADLKLIPDTFLPTDKQLHYIITGLKPENHYEVFVYAENRFGESKSTPVQKVTTEGLFPQPPAEFVCYNVTETAVKLFWKPMIYKQKQSFYLAYTRREDQYSQVVPYDFNQKTVEHKVCNLSSGTVYEFSLWAFFGNINERKLSEYCKVLIITTKGLPQDPTDFHVVDNKLTETTAEFRWKPGKYRKYVQKFVISYWLKGDEEKITNVTVDDISEKTMLSHSVSNLIEGTQYGFCIVAQNDIGKSNISETLFVQTKGRPDEPRNFRFVDDLLTDTSATFSWEPGNYRRYKQIFVISYFLEHDEQHTYEVEVEHTTENHITHTVSKLKEGKHYEFQIWAKNENGVSNVSKKLLVKAKGKPENPSELIATPKSSTSITISWTPGEYRRDIQHFVIKYGRVTVSSKRKWKTLTYQETLIYERTDSKQLYYEITGLEPASHYEVFLYAENCFGISQSTAVRNVSTEDLLPKPPAEFFVCNKTETEVQLSWRPVIYRQKQSFYLTYTSENVQNSEVISFNISQEKVEYIVSNLSPGTVYTFSLWALFGNLSDRKLSESCEKQTITTKGLPEDPVDFHLVEYKHTEETAEFRWKPGNYRKYEQTFVISYWLLGDKEHITNVNVTDTRQKTIRQSVDKLLAGKQYGFCIVAKNEIGESNISKPLIVQTKGLPEEPSHFRLVDDLLTETTATFTWEPSSYRRYQQTFFISYWLENDVTHTFEVEVQHTTEKHITHTVSNLKEGKQYKFQIRAKNINGVTNNCAQVLIETKGKPENPSELIATPKTPKSLSISWTPGGYRRDIQSFVIKYGLVTQSSKRTWKTLTYHETINYQETITNQETLTYQGTDSKQLYYEITGLEPASYYEVFVYAENCFGISESTPVQNVSTEGLLPLPPEEFLLSNKTETEVQLSWRPVIYRQKQSFYLTYTSEKVQNSEVIPFDINQENVEHIISKLSPGTVYKFSLWAFFGNLSERKLSESCQMQTITTKGLPEDPADFNLVEEVLNETTAEFCWKPGNYRTYVQTFVISYWLQGDEEHITNVNVNDTHQTSIRHSVDNLKEGEKYVFCIMAENEVGKSNISKTVLVQTKGDPYCPVKMYLEYESRRPLKALQPESRFYLGINHCVKAEDQAWYLSTPLGKNTLGSLAKKMSESAGFTARHVNHSGRKTVISNLLDAGCAPTEVAQLSGHKNLISLNSYHALSTERQKVMSTIIHKNCTATSVEGPVEDDVTDAEMLELSHICPI